MGKETYYFSHDYNARNDRKIAALVKEYKASGYGVFWATCEMMHEEGGELEMDEITYSAIAKDLNEEVDFIKNIIEKCITSYKLFIINDLKLNSNRIARNLNKRNEISEKRRKAAFAKHMHANAGQPYTSDVQNDAKEIKEIKERKGKENKVNKEQQAKPVGFVATNKIVSSKKNAMSTAKDTEGIPLPFNSPEFASIWKEWLQSRKEARVKNYTPTGLKRLFNWLAAQSNGDESVAIQIIDQSLTKGWQGLFELKPTYKNGTHQQQPASIGKTIEFD